jgi:hypothetical protein
MEIFSIFGVSKHKRLPGPGFCPLGARTMVPGPGCSQSTRADPDRQQMTADSRQQWFTTSYCWLVVQ